MAQYLVQDHPLLRELAASVQPEALDVQATIAEASLGLRGTRYRGQNARDAATAVALQVRFQLTEPEAFRLSSVSRGSRRATYRGALVDPHARKLVAALAAIPVVAALR